MRVHVIQLGYGDDESPADRTRRVADLVRAQRGADLVVLPELWPQGGFSYDRWEDEAESLDGPVVEAMRAAARDVGATVHMGSLVERDEAGRLFNTSVLLGPDGATLATYRKVHLFGFGEGEPKLMSAGDGLVVHGRLGLATCYDLRFPEQFRLLLDAGAEVVLLVAAWPAKRVAHWRLLAQARAVENQTYVVACNTAGTHAGVPMGGRSIVVEPWGAVLAEADEDEVVLVVDLDLELVRATREQFPVLADRRL
ncbi:MAG TPA: carbon-nitrogen family hydrolase [Actinomycetes bacterium]|nr:carbon-nitrogen family hydrolase [Actinomycetes bacterium]